MAKINYTENFFSIQGEGRYIGVPSVFLRTFGCNFRCKNFGRDKGDTTENSEVRAVINKLDSYEKYTDLPLVTTGCDSYSSVYPEFKKFVVHSTTDELVEKIMEILPHNRWVDEHLVITGGEPLLGWQRAYPDLLTAGSMSSLKELTFETNGTQPLTDELYTYLSHWKRNREKNALTFSVSPKLSISGEKWEDAIRPDIIRQYDSVGFVYLKFVVATEDDIKDAEKAVKEYQAKGFKGPVYVMPVGGTNEQYHMNTRAVAQFAMNKGWRYSPRLQCDIFSNEWNT